MADLTVEPSKKFHGAENQYLIHDGEHIYFRVIQFQSCYVLMTATASEDDASRSVSPSMSTINQISEQVFIHRALPFGKKRDRFGKDFLEVGFDGCLEKEVGKPEGSFEMGDVVCEIVDVFKEAFPEVQPRNELVSLYRTLENDADGGDFYLSDGVFLTSSGDLVER